MAKRLKKVSVTGERPQVKTLRSNQPIKPDSSILAAIEAVTKKHNRTDQIAGNPKVLNHVLPVPSLALRYLLQNEGLPLGLVYHIVGPPASFKSTLGVEFGRWHRDLGGAIIVCGAEDKDTPDLRNSILDWDDTAVIYRDCEFIEVWQSTIIDYVQSIKSKLAKEKDGYIPPVSFIVDSYMGKLPKRLYDNVLKSGYASKHFGEAAALIGDWLAVYSSIVRNLPMTLIGINHLKESIDPVTQMKVYRTPGGQFLKHQNVTEITVRRGKTERKEQDGVPYHINHITMKTTKNSRGAENKKISVPLRQWNEFDEETESIKLMSVFEWHDAAIGLLHEGDGMSAAESKIVLPKIKDIINVQKLSNAQRYWCEQLDVPRSDAMAAYDLYEMIEAKPDLLAELYIVLGVVRRPFFDVNLPYEEQLQEYADEGGVESVEDGTEE